MAKVEFELATAEVEKWLDYKRIPNKKREALSSMKDNMVDQVMEGNLIVNDDFTLTQIIQFPEDCGKQELTYKARITTFDMDAHKRIVKGDDWTDNSTRAIMALTGQPLNVVKKLDSSTDRALAESITTFFL